MKRVGIFGGTFSPPHNGHVHAAKEFLSAEKLDALLVIPTFLPPHKTMKGDATPEERLRMCSLAFDFDPRISVSDIEIRRGGKSYTAETLEALSEDGVRLIFLCGTDMFLTMDLWYAPERIFKAAEIVYMRRESLQENEEDLRQKANEYRKKYGATVREIKARPYELSSSVCRDGLRDATLSSDAIPKKVWEYIEKCKLYRT